MLPYIAAYLATAFVMVALDFIWLGFIAKSLYQNGIGHLMAAQPNLGVALAFYLLYSLGVVLFAVAPIIHTSSVQPWSRVLLAGALFGFFAYATYDLSNWATLRDWPWHLALIDIAWGTAVTLACAAAGKAAFDSVARQ